MKHIASILATEDNDKYKQALLDIKNYIDYEWTWDGTGIDNIEDIVNKALEDVSEMKEELKIGMYTENDIFEYLTNGGGSMLGRSIYDAIFDKIHSLITKNNQLEKQLEYLRSGEYLNQLKFERNMLENIVATGQVSEEDKKFIDMTHRNSELLEENQQLKEEINKISKKELKIMQMLRSIECCTLTKERIDQIEEVMFELEGE